MIAQKRWDPSHVAARNYAKTFGAVGGAKFAKPRSGQERGGTRIRISTGFDQFRPKRRRTPDEIQSRTNANGPFSRISDKTTKRTVFFLSLSLSPPTSVPGLVHAQFIKRFGMVIHISCDSSDDCTPIRRRIRKPAITRRNPFLADWKLSPVRVVPRTCAIRNHPQTLDTRTAERTK